MPAMRHGGPPVAAHAVARELLKLGHRVFALTCDLDQGEPLAVPRGIDCVWEEVPVRYCKAWDIWNFFSPELGQELRRRIGDYEVCLARGNWGYINYITRWVCTRAGVPYVLYPEGSFDPWAIRHKAWKKRLWWMLGEKTNYQQAAAVVALTRIEAEQVRRMGVKTRIEVIPNGVNLLEFAGGLNRIELAERFPTLGSEPFLLFLGRLHKKKGIAIILSALARLPRRFQEVSLVVAGPDEGNYRYHLERVAQDLNLQNRVKFIGPVTGEVKVGLLKEAELFIATSLSEGLPLAVLEAMACGTPVLLSPFCNLPEVAEAGAGSIVPLQPEVIANQLEALLANDSGRQQMGNLARRLVAEKFTWTEVGKLTEALCAEIAARS